MQPMTLGDHVKDAAAKIVERRADDASLRALMDFYREMERSGVAVKRTYDIPLIDTIGKAAYQTRQGAG